MAKFPAGAATRRAMVVKKAKKVRADRGREAAKAAAKMTKEQWVRHQVGMAEKWPRPDYMSVPRTVVFVKDGGEGAYRDETYAIVTRWTEKTKISYRPHAKAPGSKSHIRYEKYAKARTVGEALKLGSYPLDWCHDYEHGFIKVRGPVRDEPVDITKVDDVKKLTDVDLVIHRWYRRELSKMYGLSLDDLIVDKGSGESLLMRAHRLVAQREAQRRLKAAERAGRSVTEEEVEATLREWAFGKNAARVNVMRKGQTWVWSDNLGLVRDRHGSIHITQATQRYPDVARLFCKWVTDRLPPEVAQFKFTSMNVNCDYAARRHRDGNNFGPSLIKAFGSFSGGELNVFPEDDRSLKDVDALRPDGKVQLDIKSGLAMFNGNSAHEVEDFQGNRFSLVYFTLGCHAGASQEDKAALQCMGFPVPAPDADPREHLRAPRGSGPKGASAAASRGPRSREKPVVRFWPRAVLERHLASGTAFKKRPAAAFSR